MQVSLLRAEILQQRAWGRHTHKKWCFLMRMKVPPAKKNKKQKSTAWPVQALSIFSGSFTLAPRRIFTLKRVSWLGCLRRASARSITLHFRGNLLLLQMYQVAEAQMDSVITKQQLFRKWNTLTWLCVLNVHKRISAIVFSPLWLGLYPTLRDAVPSWTLDAI